LHIAPSGSPQPTKQAFFANYIRAFRTFSRSKNLTAVYAYRKAQKTKFYRKLSLEPQIIFRRCFFRKTRKMSDGVLSVLRANFDAIFGKADPNLKSFFGDVFFARQGF